MDSTERETLPAVFVQQESHAQWEPHWLRREAQLLRVEDKQCSNNAKISVTSAKLLIRYIAISRKEQCSRDVCAERGTGICRNWLAETHRWHTEFLLQSQSVAI